MSDWDDDIGSEEGPCPKCGEHELRSRSCGEINCDDGWCDEYEDDPINYAPGEEFTMCQECCGTGVVRWCSKCGFDVTLHEYNKRKRATP